MAVHDVGSYRGGPLRPGQVFSIDPQLRVREENLYLRFEDTVVVTETGVENFTDFIPMELDDMEKMVREKGIVQQFPPVPASAIRARHALTNSQKSCGQKRVRRLQRANRSPARYFSPVSTATVATRWPAPSSRASWSAATTLRPVEMPAKMPSSFASRRAIARASSSSMARASS